jgi:Uma2 family endonuclease
MPDRTGESEERAMTLSDVEGLIIEDLEAMPEDGRRYELLGGSIVVNAAPAPRHQLASGVLFGLLRQACPGGHVVLYAPVDLDLPGGQRVEPDLIVAPASSVGEARLSLPVLLVVELISPTTVVWDTVAKRQAYAEAGIEHYWMVDTREGRARFTALALVDGSYDTVADDTEQIEIDVPVPVSTPLVRLFELPPS